MRTPVTRLGLLIGLAALAAGCPVTQPKPPGQITSLTEKTTGRTHHLYVPTNYTPEKKWPLVVTLHGTHGWDGSKRQVQEWAYLAEEKSFIVVAPYLTSTQGILPKVKSLWFKELEKDDRTILAVIAELQKRYAIATDAVLLSGFSAGGYPMYYTGLKHPERFSMLVARACNSSVWLFEQLTFTEAARNMPIAIFFGGDDLKPIQDQSWAAYRYLRGNRKCFNTVLKETQGGHLRRPETAYTFWLPVMPRQYRKP